MTVSTTYTEMFFFVMRDNVPPAVSIDDKAIGLRLL